MGILESIFGVVGGGTLLIAFAVLFLVFIFLLAAARVLRFIRKVPPNRALLVYGVRTHTRVTVVRRTRKLKASEEAAAEPPPERREP